MESYERIANELRLEITAGDWDRTDRPFPSVRNIADRFGVSPTTAGRAVDVLVTLGHLRRIGGPTKSPVVTPPEARRIEWASTGRYARARAARGLVYALPSMGAMVKETRGVEWTAPPDDVANILGDGGDVLARTSRTVVDGRPLELTTMYFPQAVVEDVAARPMHHPHTGEALAAFDDPAGNILVVAQIEATGRSITGTRNRITARQATDEESNALAVQAQAVVLVHTHVTMAGDEPVEAVVNVRSSDHSVITFDTYEGVDP